MAHPGIVYLDENSQPHLQQRQARRCCAGFNGLGIMGCLFSILGVFTFGIASPLGLGLSLLALGRRPRFAAWTGTLLGAAGTAFLALWGWVAVASYQAIEYDNQADQTEVAMQHAARKVEDFRGEHKALPEGVDGNKLLISAKLNDAWGESLRYDPINENEFLIRSSGPDKKFDTPDDLTLR